MAFFKKRGSEILTVTVILLLIGLYVFFALPLIAKECASGKTAMKAAVARDIALILDSIYSSPYDIVVEYDTDLKDFSVLISDKKVKVNSASISIDPAPAEYPFVPTDDDPNFGPLIKPNKLLFKKENGKLSATALYLV